MGLGPVDSSSSLSANTWSRDASPSLEGLQRGSRGPDVLELQRQLNARGERLAEDGIFGPKTEAALKRFQGTCGADRTGRVDTGTATALRSPSVPTATPEPPPAAPAPRASAETQAAARARATACDVGSRAALEAALPRAAAPAPAAPAPSAERPTTGLGEGYATIPAQHGGPRVLSEAPVSRGGSERPATGLGAGYTNIPAQHGGPQVLSEAPVTRGDIRRQAGIGTAESARPGDGAPLLTDTGDTAPPTGGDVARASGGGFARYQRAREERAAATAQRSAATAPATTGPATTAPAATAAPATEQVLTAGELREQRQGIAAGRRQLAEERNALGTTRVALEREIASLGTPTNDADKAVLAGRRAQLENVTSAERFVEQRERALGARERALVDGKITPDEREALDTVNRAVENQRSAQADHSAAATSLVRRGLAQGGRSAGNVLEDGQAVARQAARPAAPESAAAPQATRAPEGVRLSSAEIAATNLQVDQALRGVEAQRDTLTSVQRTLTSELGVLRRNPRPSEADRMVIQGREAQLQTVGEAFKHLDVRTDGLRAVKRAVSDGILTPDEARNLAVADQALSEGERIIAAKWNTVTDLTLRARQFGGLGSNDPLEPFNP